MANEIPITVVGNLVADPELRYTQSGLAVANITIAQTPRTFDRATNDWKDGDAVFMRGSVWREQAEHIAASLTKGMRVIATGHLKQSNFQDKETGANRSSLEMDIQEVGPSLRYGTAVYSKSAPTGQNQAPQAPAQAQAPQQFAPQAPAPAQFAQAPAQQQFAQAPAQAQQFAQAPAQAQQFAAPAQGAPVPDVAF